MYSTKNKASQLLSIIADKCLITESYSFLYNYIKSKISWSGGLVLTYITFFEGLYLKNLQSQYISVIGNFQLEITNVKWHRKIFVELTKSQNSSN